MPVETSGWWFQRRLHKRSHSDAHKIIPEDDEVKMLRSGTKGIQRQDSWALLSTHYSPPGLTTILPGENWLDSWKQVWDDKDQRRICEYTTVSNKKQRHRIGAFHHMVWEVQPESILDLFIICVCNCIQVIQLNHRIGYVIRNGQPLLFATHDNREN